MAASEAGQGCGAARRAVDIGYKNIDISHSLIDKLTFAQSQFKITKSNAMVLNPIGIVAE